MFDLAASGVLGTGTIDALATEGDTITLGWTRQGTVLTHDVIVVTWDASWNIQANHSMTYNHGGSPSSLTNWTAVDGGTPGWGRITGVGPFRHRSVNRLINGLWNRPLFP